jgi:hypothetical protein
MLWSLSDVEHVVFEVYESSDPLCYWSKQGNNPFPAEHKAVPAKHLALFGDEFDQLLED